MIKITAANRDAIEAMLAKANGKAGAHTYVHCSSIEAIAEAAENRLVAVGVPKAERTGAAYRSTSGDRVASSYNHSRRATVVDLLRRAGGWYLVTASEATIWQQAPNDVITLTAAQDAKAVAALRSNYRIAA
jgi:hypothetical protein